jgi:hypothetical protein
MMLDTRILDSGARRLLGLLACKSSAACRRAFAYSNTKRGELERNFSASCRKRTGWQPALPRVTFRDRAMNFRVEHRASSIKNPESSIESQHSVT